MNAVVNPRPDPNARLDHVAEPQNPRQPSPERWPDGMVYLLPHDTGEGSQGHPRLRGFTLPRPSSFFSIEEWTSKVGGAIARIEIGSLESNKLTIEQRRDAYNAQASEQRKCTDKQRAQEAQIAKQQSEADMVGWLKTIGLFFAAGAAYVFSGPFGGAIGIALTVLAVATCAAMCAVSFSDNVAKCIDPKIDISINALIDFSIRNDAMYASLSDDKKKQTSADLSMFAMAISSAFMAAGPMFSAFGPMVLSALRAVGLLANGARSAAGALMSTAAREAARNLTLAQGIFGTGATVVSSTEAITQANLDLQVQDAQFIADGFKNHSEYLAKVLNTMTESIKSAVSAMTDMTVAMDDMRAKLSSILEANGQLQQVYA
ncbi:hypothetical protein [Variovorax sp. KK3]|uniref:hypothetical protein n=1 Tax=Variovorax sp. KK3 TaxID=1855728 RepID=UPI001180605B|nr:hypothetical protein [Variovorax sp. KK3]